MHEAQNLDKLLVGGQGRENCSRNPTLSHQLTQSRSRKITKNSKLIKRKIAVI